MKKIRIGKDIKIRWSITVNGEPADLASMDLKLVVQDAFGRCREQSFGIEGSDIVFTYRGTEQKTLGKYITTLWANRGKDGQTCLDNCEAFYLVARTCQEEDGASEGLSVETINLSGDIALGVQGESAYEAWLSLGNKGSVQDFIESLKGQKGDRGEKGEKGLTRDKGERGERGEQGIQGERGLQGIQGERGPQGEPLRWEDLTQQQKNEFKDSVTADIITSINNITDILS